MGSDNADHRPIGQFCQAADAPQARALSTSLRGITDLLWADLTAIQERVNVLRERPVAPLAAIALAAFASFPVFVGCGISADRAVHRRKQGAIPLLV